MLPFMRSQRPSAAMSAPVQFDEYDMLDAVADDLMEAVEMRDKSKLREALEALCQHIMTIDETQDQELMESNP